MRIGGLSIGVRVSAIIALLALVVGCEGFRELPLVRDAASDRVDATRADAADVTPVRDAGDAGDVSDVSDASDVSDVSDVPPPPPVDAGPCGGACASGQLCCDNRCVDPMTDPGNCGSCAVTCVAANASSTCQRGACAILCRPGYGDCDANPLNGCETDLSSSAFHCGACGAACPMSREVPICDSGRCRFSCVAGWGNCDGNADNGCEANLQTSLDHCNGCENPCRTNHNGPYCDGPSACRLGACEAGWADCNTDRRDGCEVHTDADVANCGMCGRRCPGGAGSMPTCSAGMCGLAAVTCTDPRAECDGVVSPMSAQCETDISTSATDCGRCGNACSTNNATSRCVARACVLTCNAGFGDCDGNVANGCETNLNTSASNCGMCGRACMLPNADGVSCAMGACVPGTCAMGFGNCDGVAANGCETNTRTSAMHCGACGRACVTPNATPACVGSLCAVGTCNAGFADCDRNPANGCEVNLQTDPRHCGACGQFCNLPNANPFCTAGRCTTASCFPPYADCDANPANGCETYIQADPRNCGACRISCPVLQRCVGRACML